MNYNFEKLLLKTIKYLKSNYDLDVYLFDHQISLADQVAQWENNIIAIDVRKRGVVWTLFILSHVFWHLVQYWTTHKYDNMLEIVNSRPLPLSLSNDFKVKYFIYEEEAFKIWKWLLKEIFDFDKELDQKYISFMYTDYEHFWNFLITWKKGSMEDFHYKWDKNFLKEKNDEYMEFKGIKPPLNLDLSRSKKYKITVV